MEVEKLQKVFNPEIDLQVNIFLQYLISMTGFPVTVVEAGTFKGDFALAAGDVMRQMGQRGKVFTADPVNQGVVERVKEEGLEEFVEYYEGTFEKMLTHFSQIHVHTVDFAFIDSGPLNDSIEDRETFVAERGVRYQDYERVKPYMTPGGLIVVDDMTNIAWDNSEKILAETDIFLKGGRGLTIKQMR